MLNVKKIKVNKKLSDEIENFLLDPLFDWYHNDSTSNEYAKSDTFQFTHQFYFEERQQSGAMPLAIKLFNELKIGNKKFHRIKANFTTNNNKSKGTQHPHRDFPKGEKGYKTFLYYVNNSDGDTIFYDDKKKEVKRFKPTKGLGLLFDSTILHAGNNPVKSDKRLVINFIFYE